jgi:hypothetical protein
MPTKKVVFFKVFLLFEGTFTLVFITKIQEEGKKQ